MQLREWVNEMGRCMYVNTLFLQQTSAHVISTTDAFSGKFYKLESLDFRISGNPAIRKVRKFGNRISRHLDFWRFGNLAVRKSRFLEIRTPHVRGTRCNILETSAASHRRCPDLIKEAEQLCVCMFMQQRLIVDSPSHSQMILQLHCCDKL